MFRDKFMGQQLAEQGFAIVPFLTKEEVAELQQAFASLNIDLSGSGFQVGLHKSLDVARRSFEYLKEFYPSRLDRYFQDYQVVLASFVNKNGRDEESTVPPHKDLMFTDPAKGFSYNVWVPLVDTTPENGALSFIPGSHNVFNCVTGSPVSQFYPPVGKHVGIVSKYLQMRPMKAGEMAIFDNRTIHASAPNLSGTTRLAAVCCIMESSSKFIHNILVPGQDLNKKPWRVNRYLTKTEFFFRHTLKDLEEMYDKGILPTEGDDFRLEKELEYFPQDLSADDVQQTFDRITKSVNNENLISKLGGMLRRFANRSNSVQNRSDSI